MVPKKINETGLAKREIVFSDEVLNLLIDGYTREAGVRGLEKVIGKVCRTIGKNIVLGEETIPELNRERMEEWLGPVRYEETRIEEVDGIGLVRGMGWTPYGGSLLPVEVVAVPGKGKLILTGQLGDVMKESAQAGISYIRSISSKYKVAEDFFEKHDIHIHIPEGAVPKDGPSAGITMATAMLSAITDKKVRADLAMTGEITLRGRVLPIGGLKEKLLAAKNAGIRTVLVPRENKKDVDELSSEITKGLEIIPVSQMEEVLKIALMRTRRKKDGN